MEIRVTRDVEPFAKCAGQFLGARIERNVLATVFANVLEWSHRAVIDAIFAVGFDPRTREPLAAALRTPPWEMVATAFHDAEAAELLVERWLKQDPKLSGVSGEPSTARAIAHAWAEQTGGTFQLRLTEAMHQLSEVIEPARPASGHLRQAGEADREMLVEWERAFSIEARSGEPRLAEARVARRLAGGYHYVWEDDGPVSMLAHTVRIEGVSRIGPVYTPPELRGHGYATSAVAAMTRLLLDRGDERCMIYTDVSNPISTKIYASLGYRKFGEWEVFEFRPPSGHEQLTDAQR